MPITKNWYSCFHILSDTVAFVISSETGSPLQTPKAFAGGTGTKNLT